VLTRVIDLEEGITSSDLLKDWQSQRTVVVGFIVTKKEIVQKTNNLTFYE
jgi:hypothetical protein